ncbi:IS701 family transposase [Streptomyces syringium]|uniref:IS701 family transposase n=1 Tax=Streptomyces syringium TaxID=76729 RepID=UPI0033ED9690
MNSHASATTWASTTAFADRLFAHLPRTDQRQWAHTYLTGLLNTTGKKSVRRLAATVSGSPTASHSLHQFINASPWKWRPVRDELLSLTSQFVAPQAWIIDLAIQRKRGGHSCGVHQRSLPATGRSVTCQVGIGAFLATQEEALPVDWRLLLPEAWTKDPQRRLRARIPDHIGSLTLEQQALDLVDALAARTGAATVPVVADLGAGPGALALASALSRRNHDFVITVPASTRTAASGRLADRHTCSVVVAGARTMRNLTHPGSDHGTYRLFTAPTEDGLAPGRAWLTNMTHAGTAQLLTLVRMRSRAVQAVQRLQNDFGLGDFEGRSYPGWHHHMTLVSAAYACSRLTRIPSAPQPLPALT